ncbi:50S ribosomal subunit protein L34 [Candidatus Vidania fulgoroideae]|nr:50S ribosomal subunit protein L34 [Candidatus Vidania fulgoroideae]
MKKKVVNKKKTFRKRLKTKNGRKIINSQIKKKRVRLKR